MTVVHLTHASNQHTFPWSNAAEPIVKNDAGLYQHWDQLIVVYRRRAIVYTTGKPSV